MSPGLSTYTATISGPTGAITCTLQVIKEGEQNKVERFTIP